MLCSTSQPKWNFSAINFIWGGKVQYIHALDHCVCVPTFSWTFLGLISIVIPAWTSNDSIIGFPRGYNHAKTNESHSMINGENEIFPGEVENIVKVVQIISH
mmetsp:Transcript_23765/g.36071  ORF Transcript_23765/g.36071 Transcript_23765/m.36071 type:complete len:102 (+) Transcript_23765:1053-1358(+)